MCLLGSAHPHVGIVYPTAHSHFSHPSRCDVSFLFLRRRRINDANEHTTRGYGNPRTSCMSTTWLKKPGKHVLFECDDTGAPEGCIRDDDDARRPVVKRRRCCRCRFRHLVSGCEKAQAQRKCVYNAECPCPVCTEKRVHTIPPSPRAPAGCTRATSASAGFLCWSTQHDGVFLCQSVVVTGYNATEPHRLDESPPQCAAEYVDKGGRRRRARERRGLGWWLHEAYMPVDITPSSNNPPAEMASDHTSEAVHACSYRRSPPFVDLRGDRCGRDDMSATTPYTRKPNLGVRSGWRRLSPWTLCTVWPLCGGRSKPNTGVSVVQLRRPKGVAVRVADRLF